MNQNSWNRAYVFEYCCRNICILPTHDVGRERYLTLLGALHGVDNKIGYRFLFFLKARLDVISQYSSTTTLHERN